MSKDKDKETTENQQSSQNDIDALSEIAAGSTYASQSVRLDELPEGFSFTDEDDLKRFDEVLIAHDKVARIVVPSTKEIFTGLYHPVTPAENAICTGILFGMTPDEMNDHADEIAKDSEYLHKLYNSLSSEEKLKRKTDQDIRYCYFGSKKPKFTLKRLESWQHTADGAYIINAYAAHIKGDIVGQKTSASLFPEVDAAAAE